MAGSRIEIHSNWSVWRLSAICSDTAD